MRVFALAFALFVAPVASLAASGTTTLFAPVASLAASGTTTLSVTASVPANCSVGTNNAVHFGTYDTTQRAKGGPLDVTVQAVTIACTKGASGVTIGLDDGEYARGSHRAMAASNGGSDTVAYDIYTTPQRSTVWNATNTVVYTADTSRAVNLPLYGRIPAGQAVTPGRYSDVLLAMVNF